MKKMNIFYHLAHILILVFFMIFPVNYFYFSWDFYLLNFILPYIILFRMGIILVDNFFNIQYMKKNRLFFLTLLISFPLSEYFLFLPPTDPEYFSLPNDYYIQNFIWVGIEMVFACWSYFVMRKLTVEKLWQIFHYGRNFLLVGFCPFYIYLGILDVTYFVVRDFKKNKKTALLIEVIFLLLLFGVFSCPMFIFTANIERYAIVLESLSVPVYEMILYFVLKK